MKTFFWITSASLIAITAPAATEPPVPSAAPNSATADNAVYRTWTDTQGRKLEATFRGFQDGEVYLQVKNGYVYKLPLDKLSPDDQKVAQSLKPEGLGIPVDPTLAQAAAKIDFLVEAGLKHKDQKPNPLASDEQFVRRVYLDIVGRIPTREEALELINDTSVSKRAKLIDKLLASDGANSHLFNYFADMLRIADVANKGRFYTYQEWLKGRLQENVGWDKIVYEMMTADGKLLDNGATGYLLRDAGMRLDNLSLTLSTFLGANVSCAQCHDHPFADWTQKQFYEMASFFGGSETYGAKGAKGGSDKKAMAMAVRSLEDRRLQQQAKNLLRINAFEVEDKDENDLKLPDDYKYKDGKPGETVKPKLVTWSKDDTHLRAYRDVTTKEPAELRAQFAKWMTAPDNPRFAMTIANRMWKRAFGVGVREPVTDLDDPNTASNPPLLLHLTSEMVRLKFDLKAFMRLIYNTQAYQREATSYEFEAGTAYMFPGPVLRRMTAEQAWDSCATLAVGPAVDHFKSKRAAEYAKAMKIDFTASNLEEQIKNALTAMRGAAAAGIGGKGGKGKGKAAMRKRMMAQEEQGSEDGEILTRPPTLGGMVLARASELPQPEKDQHFLRQFGQSDRQIADSSSDEGNIPQVLMLMNGDAQAVIGSPRSLVVQTADKQATPEEKIESLYVSFFCRKPKADEVATAKEALAGGLGLSDLTWVLFNTREFVFIE
ncbi:MAG: DUF1553 domain-containing protein [Verrucomicrobiaceae bacterium]|nr:DUF1553 domain-containing protein [Verrucomicrobiaceae bacterium]